MKRFVLLMLAIVMPMVVMAQTTVFSDNFSSSTINVAPTPPTSSSTTWEIAATKNATAATIVGTGDLKLTLNSATTSGFLEAQALFTTTPVTLASAGDYIRLSYTFTDTANILTTGASQLYAGLYNSGGSAPTNGLANAGLTATAGSIYATGGAQLWQGYNGRIGYVTNASAIYTRPQQNGAGTTSANQSLLGNTGGGSYVNPTGANLVSATGGAALTTGSIYTDVLVFTYNGSGLVVSNILYSGAGMGGSVVYSQTATAAIPLTLSFDGLAIGTRYNGATSANPIMDVSLVTVDALIQPIPEPSIVALAGLGGLLGLAFARRMRR
jgi:hypothetical protein